MLNVTHLAISYDSSQNVLENLSFSLAPSQVLGIIGLNGSGKTTLLKALSSQIRFNGQITMNGIGIHSFLDENRHRTALLADTPFLYPFLTVLEYIEFVVGLKERNPKELKNKMFAALERFALYGNAHTLCSKLSFGQKKKVYLVAHLLCEPIYAILDEPTNGLDIQSIFVLEHMIRDLSELGSTIVVSTHNLSFLRSISSNVLFIGSNKQHIHFSEMAGESTYVDLLFPKNTWG